MKNRGWLVKFTDLGPRPIPDGDVEMVLKSIRYSSKVEIVTRLVQHLRKLQTPVCSLIDGVDYLRRNNVTFTREFRFIFHSYLLMIDQQLEHHVTPLRIDKDFDFIRNMKILTIKIVRIQALSIDTLSNLRGILKDTVLQLERIRFHEQFLCNEISRSWFHSSFQPRVQREWNTASRSG